MNKEIDKQIFELWKVAINTQMHFNDLIIKIRTLVTSLTTTIFGASALVMSQSNYSVSIFNRSIHVSILIIIAGFILLIAYLILDFLYYFQLLLSAVSCTREIEKNFPKLTLTTTICKFVTKRRAYTSLIIYYFLAFLTFFIVLISIIKN